MASVTAASVTEKLAKLSHHAQTHVWSPKTDIDWATGGDWFEKLSHEEKAALQTILSLVYHSDSQGHTILGDVSKSLRKEARQGMLKREPDLSTEIQKFLAIQSQEEDRHALALKTLFEKLDLTPEPQAFSHRFYSKFLVSGGFVDAKLILVYWYIEIVAKNIFVELKQRFPDTVIDAVFTRIVRDEARHASFGEVYIPYHAANISLPRYAGMVATHLSSYAALPGLFRFGHYSQAARVLKLNLSRLFGDSLKEIAAKIERLPANRPMPALKKSSEQLSQWVG